jgi:hypothetical protein
MKWEGVVTDRAQQGTLSRSPPPCGEGIGRLRRPFLENAEAKLRLWVGVHVGSLFWVPPSLTLPRKGGGNGEAVLLDTKRRRDA